jgi:GT2 family glycosyltransferase/SAM-dependent methyltransferase
VDDEIRRDEAPRLIDWTGERMVPWAPDVQVIYEHLHRYWWAAALAQGRRVLDVGSGEGYGTAILASAAASACGIELDEESVAHSRANYQADNLEFRVGSALDLSAFADGEFGLVVCFEVLEHIAEQEQLLDGIARVLAPDGVLLCSTPERTTYTELAGHDNPFHVRELTEAEFRAMLGARFPEVRLWGQRTSTGSAIYPIDGAARTGQTVFVEPDGDAWRRASAPIPMYMIAMASAQPLAHVPDQSALVDASQALLRGVYDELGALHERAGRRIDQLVGEVNDRAAEVLALTEALSRTEPRLRRIESSPPFRALKRARDAVVHNDISPRTAVGRLLATRAVRFPDYASVKASIVIPIHNQTDATMTCLRAVAANTTGVPYEVILVDDASGPELVSALGHVHGARVVRNQSNQGFLQSANRGIATARGEYVVLLNNDTEVLPGWLTSMVTLADSADDIGAVAAKLLLPGRQRIQEAGGIIWRDGSAMHAGREEHRYEASYNYVRPVDYGSGACLLVRGDVLRELGGFDDRYAPAYYEDADLCFELRARGLRVMYQPLAEVVHHEGTSHGTDVSTGIKANQARNATIFREKWAEVLDREQSPPDPEHQLRHHDRTTGPRVVVADFRVPITREDAGSLRMREILLALRELGFHVTFMPENRIHSEPDTGELQQAGIEVLYGPFDERHVLTQYGDNIKLAILSRPTVAARLVAVMREVIPSAHIAYDTVDLHYLREQRRAAANPELELDALISVMRELELAMIRCSDETITVSEEEGAEVQSEVPGTRVTVIPTINRVPEGQPTCDGRKGIMFLGGFQHPPNVDCVVHLVRDVLPLVRREIGEVPVTIVGSHPTDAVRALADEVEGVEVTGFVDDVAPYFQRARLMAAPLRFGAGVNGKITHSLASGLPVVTSSVGAEGLSGVSGEHFLVADDDTSFAAAIADVYRDNVLWKRLATNGRALAAQRFSPDVVRSALAAMLERL